MRSRTVAIAVLTTALAALLPVPAATAAPRLATRVIQSGLEIPWDVAFTPRGRMIVSERPGRIRIYADRTPGAALLATHTISNMRAEGESGVMGIAVRKGRDITHLYVCASRQVEGAWRNQVLDYRMRGTRLRFRRYLVRYGLRANSFHNGCAVELGRDGKIWVGTGDAGDLSLPQSGRSFNGKVLRINPDGSVPRDNPNPRSLIYTRGHRNIQGIAFLPGTTRVYAIEHGPDRNDEVNRLRPGHNYGWPCYTGASTPFATSGCRPASSYTKPAWSSGSPTLATSGGAFMTGSNWGMWRNDLFVSTLKQADVRRFKFNSTGGSALPRSTLLNGRYGRLRAAVRGPGARMNSLFLTTSNGSDDKVVRIRASS